MKAAEVVAHQPAPPDGSNIAGTLTGIVPLSSPPTLVVIIFSLLFHSVRHCKQLMMYKIVYARGRYGLPVQQVDNKTVKRKNFAH